MEYLSIGKISKLKNVSIKSLRYYDKIGILKPAYINKATNYRYYTTNQLYLLDAIRLCIQLGVPLKDLHTYVNENELNLQQLLFDSKMLADTKIKEIKQQIAQLESTLATAPVAINANQTVNTLWDTTTVLLLPLPAECSNLSYGSYILQLFVTAQKNGLQVNYPSGILYEQKNGLFSKYMFLELSNTSSVDTLPSIDGYSIRTLPKKNCNFLLNKERIASDSCISGTFSLEPDMDFTIIELDILDASLKNKGFHYHLFHYL